MRMALAAALYFSTTLPAADDWPTFQKDAARSGVSTNRLAIDLKPAWNFRTPLPPQPAWPDAAKWDGWHKVWDLKTRMTFDRAYHVVSDATSVYFGSSSSDQVYCLEAESGRKKWSIFTEGPVRLAPVLHKEHVYFGSDDGMVYCASASDGKVIWKQRIGPRDRRVAGNGRVISVWPVRGGLVIYDDVIYGAAGTFPSEEVFVFALSTKDGERVWMTPMNDLPAQGYLLASPTRLYVPSGRNNPIVFDRASGRRLRVVDGQGGTYCLLSGDQIIFGPGIKGQLGVIDKEEKDQLATFSGNHMLIDQGSAYLHSDSSIQALDRLKYLELARQRRALEKRRGKIQDALKKLGKSDAVKAQADILREQLVRVGRAVNDTEAAMKKCFRWEVKCDAPFSAILSKNSIIAGGDGKVVGYSRENGELLWTLPVKGRVLAMATAGGQLFASTDVGGVHCFRSEGSAR